VAKPSKPDTFFDLAVHGRVPQILRAIADRIESGEVKAERISSSVTEDVVELTLRIELHPK
jgi:hypothetical protein